MNKHTFKRRIAAVAIVLGLASTAAIMTMSGAEEESPEQAPASTGAVLTVSIITPEVHEWPLIASANGRIAPWQETVISSELTGVRIVEVAVDVGSVVRKGQVLARFESESIAAQNAEEEAAVDAQRAAAAEAQANAERARTLGASKMMSTHLVNQALTDERKANANLNLALARLQTQRIRLRQTDVRAPDDGAISASEATVGTVVTQGQALFKLIRQERLEWRAEVAPDILPRIMPGQRATVSSSDGTVVEGTVRVKAPTVHPDTLTGLVYVDLPRSKDVAAGMFTTGHFELERNAALTVPKGAVVIRDGIAYVYQVGSDNKVAQKSVTLGRRAADRIEILEGIQEDTKLVAQGAGFLADGDVVNVLIAGAAAVGRGE